MDNWLTGMPRGPRLAAWYMGFAVYAAGVALFSGLGQDHWLGAGGARGAPGGARPAVGGALFWGLCGGCGVGGARGGAGLGGAASGCWCRIGASPLRGGTAAPPVIALTCLALALLARRPGGED